MLVVEDIEPCRRAVQTLQRDGHTVGLVPTMGTLHEGHLSLIRASMTKCDATVVSIFVNPTQFNSAKDLENYPSTTESDLAKCRDAGVSVVFAPSARTMYPGGEKTTVRVSRLADGLCGPFRPGHFDGVATVVAKLFAILPADFAFFGEKDYQQLRVIQQMVADLNWPIEIVACPTVREPDGLAMSSRNARLSAGERHQATAVSTALFAASAQVAAGERNAAKLTESVTTAVLGAGPCKIDYVAVVDPISLTPLARISQAARICIAVRIGSVRLIDNLSVDVGAPPG